MALDIAYGPNMESDGATRREFTGRLRPDGDAPPGLKVTFEVDEGVVRVTGPTGELAKWSVGEVDVSPRGEELAFAFGEETIVGTLDDAAEVRWLTPARGGAASALIRYGLPVLFGLVIAAVIFSFVG